jgi:hypothetical protein
LKDFTDVDHDALVMDTLQQYMDDTSILAPLSGLPDAMRHGIITIIHLLKAVF